MKNMRKGVSAIIATILLLMITIGLAGMAYVFMSGMMTGRTSKTITVLDASCSGDSSTKKITIVVSNDGTDTITMTAGSGDLKIFVDNTDDTADFDENGVAADTTYDVSSHRTVTLVSDNGAGYYTASAAHTVLVVSPSNAIKQVVYC